MQGPVPRHQPISLFGIDIILAVAPLIRDLKNIAELFGGDGRNNCPALFDQSVCGQCGAVDEPTDLTHCSADLRHRPHRTRHGTICGIILGRHSFGRRNDAVMVVNQHCISECPTNIARDAKRRFVFQWIFPAGEKRALKLGGGPTGHQIAASFTAAHVVGHIYRWGECACRSEVPKKVLANKRSAVPGSGIELAPQVIGAPDIKI
jgi:hypothetical protein